MSLNGGLYRYLGAASREHRGTDGEEAAAVDLPFVTISRQAGAGGTSLARAILAELEKHGEDPRLVGWSYFDEGLCRRIISDPEVNVSFTELMTESYRSRAEDFVSVLLGKSFQEDVQKKVTTVIRELASMGKAILIGRGGVCITRDLEHGVHVRLVASRESRIERMAEMLDVSKQDASRKIDEQDANRARMLKVRFRANIDDPELYDVIWNTDRTPMEQIAHLVVELIRSR